MDNEHSNKHSNDKDKSKSKSKSKEVIVEVNSRPVVLTEKKMTGAEIKTAAIAQGVQIQPDFVLQLERPNGEFDTIGDADELNIRKDLSFTAIAPDDNS